ncbi:VOC family protein [Corynebacterium guangdongense]|uniref:Catechol 2,3-dioxygenase n=1 Tax=Corynebacterium guangdongense TaxID=1783348 RepID=A0ABU2A3G2_9CORY|nr:VOC family protein [Corynebacterium guangdongense]MDR7330618.1 catechol 2,3-dioxygenase [Corynebacterium guangdongense]WJZ16634.1 Catechol-2,3-dioxygenase [Corynebacterium guangdongense]
MSHFRQNPHPSSLIKRPAEDLLAAGTTMGAVELLVRDLDAMITFYHEGMLLEVLQQVGDAAILGTNSQPSVLLRQVENLPPFNPRGAGLFHTAILYDSPADLSAAVLNVAQRYPHSFTGVGDHIFSEAFYFNDPEGNGVELYRDRPRENWERDEHGLYALATLGFDPNAYLQDNLNPLRTTTADSTLGHVHLQVGDVGTARDFYAGVLGFEVTGEIDTAVFVSAGGYHHHLGLNVFQSQGAGPRAASYGLGRVDIDVPTEDDRAALAARLKDHGVTSRDDGRTLEFNDPWNSLIRVKAATSEKASL